MKRYIFFALYFILALAHEVNAQTISFPHPWAHKRVAYFGDSITDFYDLNKYYKGYMVSAVVNGTTFPPKQKSCIKNMVIRLTLSSFSSVPTTSMPVFPLESGMTSKKNKSWQAYTSPSTW